jgi:choline dehydrogenase
MDCGIAAWETPRHSLDGTQPRTLVDQYGRVHGIEGLRVVDASIMSNVTRSNTNATTIMIAERVADWMQ